MSDKPRRADYAYQENYAADMERWEAENAASRQPLQGEEEPKSKRSDIYRLAFKLEDENRTLRSHLSDALQQVAELKRDSERLDWLEKHRRLAIEPDDLEWGSDITIHTISGINDRQYHSAGSGKTIRTAIDAARQASSIPRPRDGTSVGIADD